MFEEYYALSRLMTAKTLRNLITANFSFSVPPEILVASRPVLLMAGDREDTRLLRGMEHFHHHFRNSTLRIHDGARHGLPLAQPPVFNESLQRWLRWTQANLSMPHCCAGSRRQR